MICLSVQLYSISNWLGFFFIISRVIAQFGPDVFFTFDLITKMLISSQENVSLLGFCLETGICKSRSQSVSSKVKRSSNVLNENL